MKFDRFDPYKVLGIKRNASDDEVKKAYRKASLEEHPDRNPGREREASERFGQVYLAYKVLSDPEKRAKFDADGTINHDIGDRTMLHVFATVSSILEKLVIGMVTSGTDLTTIDFLKEMRTMVAAPREKFKKKLLETQKIKMGFEEVQRRLKLKYEEGSGFLGDAARAHAQEAENKIQHMEQELELNERVMKFLDDYSYLFNQGFCWQHSTAGSIQDVIDRMKFIMDDTEEDREDKEVPEHDKH